MFKKRRSKVENTWYLLLIIYLSITSILILINKFNFFILCLIFIATQLLFIKYKKWREGRFIDPTYETIDKMSGEEFEEFLQVNFKKKGFKAYLTPYTADYGCDLVLKKSNKKIVVQAKRWNSKVGIEAVQQAVASIKYYKADKAMVITNSYYTENAKNLAKANDVELIDRTNLLSYLNIEELRCPKCSGKLTKRKGKYGYFYGCSNFPDCKYSKSA